MTQLYPSILCPKHKKVLSSKLSLSLQGLFERRKLVVATQLTMAILGKEGKLVDGRFELLISRERRAPQPSPMPDWLPTASGQQPSPSRCVTKSPSLLDLPCLLAGFRRPLQHSSVEKEVAPLRVLFGLLE